MAEQSGIDGNRARRGSSADSDSGSEASSLDPSNALQADEGWEDVEPEVEDLEILCLFGDETFPDATSMNHHCKQVHDIDLVKIRQELGKEAFAPRAY